MINLPKIENKNTLTIVMVTTQLLQYSHFTFIKSGKNLLLIKVGCIMINTFIFIEKKKLYFTTKTLVIMMHTR